MCWNLPSDISKAADLCDPLPPQTMLDLERDRNESFWDRNIIDGGKWEGDKEMNPKPIQDRVESDKQYLGEGARGPQCPESFWPPL